MLTLLNENPARIDGRYLVIDRKFVSGMDNYVHHVRARLTSVHPLASNDIPIMDPVRVPIDALGYEIITLHSGSAGLSGANDTLVNLIRNSKLVYGSGVAGIRIALKEGVPYILIRECDLATRVVVARTSVSNPVRKASRVLKCLLATNEEAKQLRGAQEVHCNGYPVYEEARRNNDRRLLYFDSRMSGSMLIDTDVLKQRAALIRRGRPFRLLYSGRYEPLKGADDAIKVVVRAIRAGADIELDCYGDGSLRQRMESLSCSCPDRIRVHDALPYPELVVASRGFDAFICCHVQNDPSCTYLEAFGAGLPIVGYGNRMWQGLLSSSGAGVSSPVGNIEALASALHVLVQQPDSVRKMSWQARDFAVAHTFENEFARRTNALNVALDRLGPARYEPT